MIKLEAQDMVVKKMLEFKIIKLEFFHVMTEALGMGI